MTNNKQKKIVHYVDKKKGLNMVYIPSFFNKRQSNLLFNNLEKEVEYNNKQDSMVTIFGKKIPIPRLQVGYGDEKLSYSFSNVTVNAKPWTPTLSIIKERIENFMLENYSDIYGGDNCNDINYVLVNRYANGNEYIGPHRDKEKELGKTPIIISLSLGAEREFHLRYDNPLNTSDKAEDIKLLLEHGSLLLILHPTNKFWKHSVPKRLGIKNPRINLTFRSIYDIN
jgi:alkylated DNA repair dioxygenase AlkB